MMWFILVLFTGVIVLNKINPVSFTTKDAVEPNTSTSDPATTRLPGHDNVLAQTESNSLVPCIINSGMKLVEGFIVTDTPNNLPKYDITQFPTGGIVATSMNNDPYVQPRLSPGNETSGTKIRDIITVQTNRLNDLRIANKLPSIKTDNSYLHNVNVLLAAKTNAINKKRSVVFNNLKGN